MKSNPDDAASRQAIYPPEPQTRLLNGLSVAVTIVDHEGRITFYNDMAAQKLDRKPDYIGRDIRFCHKEKASIEKIDGLFRDFSAGRSEPFYYEAHRRGHHMKITFAPLRENGCFIGAVQTTVFAD